MTAEQQRDQELRDAVHYLSLSLTYLREGKLHDSLLNLQASIELQRSCGRV